LFSLSAASLPVIKGNSTERSAKRGSIATPQATVANDYYVEPMPNFIKPIMSKHPDAESGISNVFQFIGSRINACNLVVHHDKVDG
jgi:hypothetical protein